jgi:hypothetical protein
MMLINNDVMAYSDVSFYVGFFDNERQLIAEKIIESLPDVLIPNGQTEIFIERDIPTLSGRKDLNYNIEVIAARPLFTSIAP